VLLRAPRQDHYLLKLPVGRSYSKIAYNPHRWSLMTSEFEGECVCILRRVLAFDVRAFHT
jgi:hypothetical protein